MRTLVVIPVHDRLEFLGDALASALRQTRAADEIIVTGNVWSDDQFSRYLEREANIRHVISDDNLAARVNQAVDSSHCDAFTVLSDDDMLEAAFLDKTVRAMERYSDDIVYTDLRRFGGATHVMHALPWSEENIELTTVPFVTSLCTKKRWKIAGGYEDVPFFDWHFWWKCFHTGASAFHLAEPLFLYREHPGQHQYQENLEENRKVLLAYHNEIRQRVKSGDHNSNGETGR